MATPMDNGYKMVADRHLQFVADHPSGSISNEVQNFIYDPVEKAGFVTVVSRVWKDKADRDGGKAPDGEGNASMQIPGTTNFTRGSEVENTETSALGRALAMVGYHAKETLASGDEINAKKGSDEPAVQPKATDPADASQKNKMFAMARSVGIDPSTDDGKELLGKIVLEVTGKKSSKQLTRGDMKDIFKTLEDDKAKLDIVEAVQAEAAAA
jgi:hypothetical protein